MASGSRRGKGVDRFGQAIVFEDLLGVLRELGDVGQLDERDRALVVVRVVAEDHFAFDLALALPRLIARAVALDVGDVHLVALAVEDDAGRIPRRGDAAQQAAVRRPKLDDGDGVVRAVGGDDGFAVRHDREGVGRAAEEELFGGLRGDRFDDLIGTSIDDGDRVAVGVGDEDVTAIGRGDHPRGMQADDDLLWSRGRP